MANPGTHSPTLQIVDEDRVGPELDAAVRRLLCACFPADAESFAARRAWHGVLPIFSVLAWRGDELAGQIGIVERHVTCGGAPVRAAGVQSLAVAPDLRGSGLSQRLMTTAMQEAQRRGIPHGLLFCLPGLEGFYTRLGWRRIDREVTMLDANGRTVPLTAKNIGMELVLAESPLPPGRIDLAGRDW
jgi:predicted N-acetyltransferase YhbS